MNVLKQIYFFFLFFIAIILVTISCKKDDLDDNESNNDTIQVPNHEDKDDYTWDPNSVVEINFNINLINSTSSNVVVSGKRATITKGGNYRLQGELNDGQIIVDVDDDSRVRLILNNCYIQYNSGPALLIEDSKKTIIFLQDNSKNKLSDWPSYNDPDADPNAALFSKSDLTIFGNGELEVTGQYKDGITSKDGLLIKSGNIKVQSVDDGIRGKDNLTIESGNITINSGGDGLKSDDEGTEGRGVVFVDGGLINISSSGDGVSATTRFTSNGGVLKILSGGGHEADTSSLSQKGIKAGSKVELALDSCDIDAVDHAVDSDDIIEVVSGKYQISSARAGLHSNNQLILTDGKINVLRSLEGCESKTVKINGGEFRVQSIDDGISATAGYDVEESDGSLIEINGGYSVFNTILGDGIDSNGDIQLKAGTVIIHGPKESPEVAVDCNNNFVISGGTLIGSGTNSEMFDYPDSTSTQNSLVVMFQSSQSANTLFHISDGQGNSVLTFQPANQFQSILISSPTLQGGITYQLFLNGSVVNGLTDGVGYEVEYSPGDLLTSLELQEKVTVVDDLSNEIEP